MGWARREGLLHGQRNKALEPLISRMRNRFAHGQYWLGTPVESARAIHDVAEVVNRLWGATTPGGRLYPAPLERDVVAIGWLTTKQGLQLTRHNPDQLPSHVREVGDDWTYLIVLAVPDDDLWEFDSVYERTAYPTRLLWGPGSASAAADWYREANIVTDTVDYLDRLFAIRVDGGTTYLPQRPEVVLSLPASRTSGDWHVIRADFPLDAFNHVRSHESEALAVEVIAITDWSGACALLRSAPTFGAHPASGPEARVPERFPLAPEAGHARSDTQD